MASKNWMVTGKAVRVDYIGSDKVACGKARSALCVLAPWRKYTLRPLRSWLAQRLGLKDNSARNGDWWEIDFILVILLGTLLAGGLAWSSL